ncbi:Retrovirus-related Pol polyprotein [Labeo rohita]|uniref:Retrovirus-related Pol polyprotein n=1 Tax=Labeo rohita TaxID=84645 RepID=A0ABQ8L901_LABRO|nr:Retrovirus-related Pol polyprotein [Labeo rohita]
MFAELLKQLRVQHQQSSTYHPQSQGSLEHFHQLLKSLLCVYCTELNCDWEEGLPWLLLAAREVTQSSLGFSPNKLVFGHKIRGPLAVLEDSLKGKEPPISLLDYVNGFRRRLFLAGQAERENLEKKQEKMKRLFDYDSEMREFPPGDQVLVLLPVPTSPFRAKFSGPSEAEAVRRLERRRELKLLPSQELTKVMHEFSALFGDTPSRTHLIEHDVEVGDASPIRQRFYRGPIVR